MWPNQNAFSNIEEEQGIRVCRCLNKHRSKNHRLHKMESNIRLFNKSKEAYKTKNTFTITESPKEEVKKVLESNKFSAALEEEDVEEKIEIPMPNPKVQEEGKNI